MAHEKRFKVLDTAARLAYTPKDGEPVVDSTRRAANQPYYFLGDGVTAGAKLVQREDSVIYLPAPTHNKTLPAAGILPVYKSGGVWLDAIAEAGKTPEVYVVDVPGPDELGVVAAGGFARLPNSNLVDEATYFLSDTVAGALLTTEPDYIVDVCSVVAASGTERWVSVLNSRPIQAPVTGNRFFRLTITNAPHYTGFGYGLAVINELRLFAGATNVVTGAVVTPSSWHGSYSVNGVQVAGAADWGSADPMPVSIVVDVGLGNEVELTSYVVRASPAEPEYFPIDFTLEAGNSLGAMTQIDAQTGHTGVAASFEVTVTL